MNPDTSNTIAPTAPFQLITGIGGHGNLRPIQSQIVGFFLVNLAHSDAKPIVPPTANAPGTRPAPEPIDAAGLQVTPTGQVATSYPGSGDGVLAEPEARREEAPEIASIDAARSRCSPWFAP